MKLPVGCKNRKNGCPKMGEEKEMEDHEIECEHRCVKVWFADDCGDTFKDLLCHMKEQVKELGGRWLPFPRMPFNENTENGDRNDDSGDDEEDEDNDNGFYRFCLGPDGHIFCIDLDAASESLFKAHAFVIGGEHVAHKYRVELRLYSSE